jgi:GTP-binding protein Era
MSEPTRCGVVAIVGTPNAGKSTLVNRLVGQKVSIVTHKAQTTRTLVRGVAIRDGVQLVLVDTPGVFGPKRRLDRAMVRAALGALRDAEAIVHVIDAPACARRRDEPFGEDIGRIHQTLRGIGRRAIAALNKIDSIARPDLLPLSRALDATNLYSDVFMISALTGDGVEDLAAVLAARAPEGPWLFPEDQVSDAPVRMLAAEITREKLMLRLHAELPYEAMVETDAWEERPDGSARVEQTIYVARESQKKIAIGEGGRVVKAIGEAARKELETLLDRRIHLFLHVKVRENWSEERARFHALGLDYEA